MDPEYRTPRTNNPAEVALAAAHNAGIVPLDGDPGRFTALDFIATALAALDNVSRHDRVTHDMVRERIGHAQSRLGW
jgi:hypothetical protein